MIDKCGLVLFVVCFCFVVFFGLFFFFFKSFRIVCRKNEDVIAAWGAVEVPGSSYSKSLLF